MSVSGEHPQILLRRLPFGGRLALSFLLAVLGGGYVASAAFLREHHQGRDDRKGLTVTDIEGVYHGTERPAILKELLERRHPEEVAGASALPDEDRELLLDWLAGGDAETIAANWANIDFGDGYGSPQEVLANACAGCHGPAAGADRRAAPTLSTWEDVKGLAFAKPIFPMDAAILVQSTHAHALALGTLTVLVVLLGYATRLPRFVISLASLGAGAGLALDLASWWLARDSAGWVTGILVGGLAHAAGVGLLLVLVFLDLWFPIGREQ